MDLEVLIGRRLSNYLWEGLTVQRHHKLKQDQTQKPCTYFLAVKQIKIKTGSKLSKTSIVKWVLLFQLISDHTFNQKTQTQGSVQHINEHYLKKTTSTELLSKNFSGYSSGGRIISLGSKRLTLYRGKDWPVQENVLVHILLWKLSTWYIPYFFPSLTSFWKIQKLNYLPTVKDTYFCPLLFFPMILY